MIDAPARRAVCGGGTTWRELDAATQEHALAVPGGFVSTTGEPSKAIPPLAELVTPIPDCALQQLFNASVPWGSLAYEKAVYLQAASRFTSGGDHY